METYEIWTESNEEGTETTLLWANNNEALRVQLRQTAVLVRVFTAPSWEEALAIKNKFLSEQE